MGTDFEHIIRASSQALHDDYELEQEVAKELRAHLEDKFAELQAQGLSEAESVEKAVKCFGDPDEIAPQLFQANAARMKWHGKLKLALKILILPLLLAVLWLSFDYRTLTGIGNAYGIPQKKKIGLKGFDFLPRFLGDPGHYTKPLSKDSLLLFGVGANDEQTLAIRKANYDKHPDELVYLNYYVTTAWELYRRSNIAVVREVLKFAQMQEPGNAYYHYWLASSYLPRHEYDTKKYEIKDWEAAGIAMQEYLKATICRYNEDYLNQRDEWILKKLFPKQDFYSRIARSKDICGVYLPQAHIYPEIGKTIPLYADRLISQGKPEEAKKLLDSWSFLIRHIFEGNDSFFSPMEGFWRIEEFQQSLPPLYEKLGYKEQADKVAEATGRMFEQRQSLIKARSRDPRGIDEGEKVWWKYGGWFGGFTKGHAELPGPEAFAPDRRLTYALADTMVLAFFGGVWSTVVLAMSICWSTGYAFGKRSHILLPGKKSCLEIFIIGFALPLILYWGWTHIDFLSGRGYSIMENDFLFHVQAFVLVVIIPLWFCMVFVRGLRRRQAEISMVSPPRISLMTLLGNLIPALIIFMAISSAALRICYYCEINHNMERDSLFFTDRFANEELAEIKATREKILPQLKEFEQ